MHGAPIVGALVCVWTTQGAGGGACAPAGIHPDCLVGKIWAIHFQAGLPEGSAPRVKTIGLAHSCTHTHTRTHACARARTHTHACVPALCMYIAKLWNTSLTGAQGKALQEAMLKQSALYKSGDNVLLMVDQWDGEGDESTAERDARTVRQVRRLAGHVPRLPLHEL